KANTTVSARSARRDAASTERSTSGRSSRTISSSMVLIQQFGEETRPLTNRHPSLLSARSEYDKILLRRHDFLSLVNNLPTDMLGLLADRLALVDGRVADCLALVDG